MKIHTPVVFDFASGSVELSALSFVDSASLRVTIYLICPFCAADSQISVFALVLYLVSLITSSVAPVHLAFIIIIIAIWFVSIFIVAISLVTLIH